VVVGSGPDHERAYEAEVFVGGSRRGVGAGRSKKDAEQEAARNAWEGLQNA
jgi:ribonuclease-3